MNPAAAESLRGGRRYVAMRQGAGWITPQAMQAPEFPDGPVWQS